MTKNLSLFSNKVIFGPDCRTTLMVTAAPGVSKPVLGRTRNFSGDVVFIYAQKMHPINIHIKSSIGEIRNSNSM